MSYRAARMALGLALLASSGLCAAVVRLWAPDVRGIVSAAALSAAIVLPFLAAAWLRSVRRQATTQLEMTLLRQAAHTDTQTALGNRRAFHEELRREVSRAARTRQPLTLALLDLDDFKAVNDTVGHPGGDRVLSELASVLVLLLRAEDRAFRYGGDEFAILMPNTPSEGALAAIRRLKLVLQEGLGDITVSIGTCTSADTNMEPNLLVERADMALYQAKHGGKDRTVAYEAEPGLAEETLAKWEQLRTLVAGPGPRIAFQPIYELSARKPFAFEALMRLPEGSLISGPLEAFEIAERVGLLFELDSLCINRAIAAARLELPTESVLFLNIDPHTLGHPAFSPSEMLRKVQGNGLEPAMVVFEVTERSTAPLETLLGAAEKLRSSGFKLAIDDVGSGNSGLEMLRRFHFDYIKIDRSVVLDAVNQGPGKAVMLAIVAFAAQSGGYVIAEGIDSAAMLSAVELSSEGVPNLSIGAVQGFLFGGPRSAQEESRNDSSQQQPAA